MQLLKIRSTYRGITEALSPLTTIVRSCELAYRKRGPQKKQLSSICHYFVRISPMRPHLCRPSTLVRARYVFLLEPARDAGLRLTQTHCKATPVEPRTTTVSQARSSP